MKKLLLVLAVLFSFPLALLAWAAGEFQAQPGVFDPGGTGIVVAQWIKNLGLPDLEGPQRFGLLLSKNGPTATNAAAGATISGVEGIVLTEIGFDINTGTHCGAGAPRFNVQASDGFHFLGGCNNGTKTPGTPDPGWTRVRINPSNAAQAFPPIAPGSTVKSIQIVFDEGTDTGPDFSGIAVLDNIDINGTLIGKPGD
jgi:hypothetical protein